MGLPRAPSSSADLPLAAPSSPARWRLWLVLLAVGWNGIFMFTNVGWKVFGLDIGGFAGQYPLFMDSMAVLAAAETHHRGGNPFKPMWLDPFHRVHSYSSWWFGLGDLGLTRADNGWFGGLLVLAFAVAVGLRLRARASGEFWWLLGTVGSLPFLIATRRANNDLVVFVLLAPLVPCLLHPSRLVRLAAPFLIAVAAGLKYYPLVAGVALLAEPDRRYRRFRLGVLALLLLMVGLSVGGDLKYLAASQPDVEGYQGFGAGFGLGLVGVPAAWQGRAGVAVGVILGLAAFFTRGWSGWLRRTTGGEQGLHFIVGAALLAGCFWAGMSWAYREVFALWLVPFLWRPVAAGPVPVAVHRWWRAARAAYWPTLWGGTVGYLIEHQLQAAGLAPPMPARLAVWSVVQAASWIFCGALTVFVGAFAWDRMRDLGCRGGAAPVAVR